MLTCQRDQSLHRAPKSGTDTWALFPATELSCGRGEEEGRGRRTAAMFRSCTLELHKSSVFTSMSVWMSVSLPLVPSFPLHLSIKLEGKGGEEWKECSLTLMKARGWEPRLRLCLILSQAYATKSFYTVCTIKSINKKETNKQQILASCWSLTTAATLQPYYKTPVHAFLQAI